MKKKRRSVITILEIVCFCYFVFSLFGVGLKMVSFLFLVSVLYLMSHVLIFWASKNREHKSSSIVQRLLSFKSSLTVAVVSAIFALFIIDMLLYARVIKTGGSYHDLDVIPFRSRILTADGYFTAVMERRFSAKTERPGQAANYLEDNDFYESRKMEVKTDEVGLRNFRGQMKGIQDIILMGDSFTFGYASDQEYIWSSMLTNKVAKNVYNIGVYGVHPSHQVELLFYLLKDRNLQLSNNPVFILLLYEGNDFNDRNIYADSRRRKTTRGRIEEFRRSLSAFFSRTLLANLSKAVRNSLSGKRRQTAQSLYAVFGSSVFGNVAFLNIQISHVINNNSDRKHAEGVFEKAVIKKTFQRLKALSTEHNARTVIFYCPTTSRVYARYFPEHPKMPERDYLKELTRSAAEDFGFAFVDLNNVFSHLAEKGELIYWRDDSHLNHQGNAVLADVTRDVLSSRFNQ